jgi:hypothetical protein
LNADRAPISYKHQQDVIDLQQEYYALYSTFPQEFKEQVPMVDTPVATKMDIVLLREDIARVLKTMV